MTHASIVPLIGGLTLASEKVFGQKPDYLLSYTPFENNDQHIVKHYGSSVPYHFIDTGSFKPHYVDVVTSVCPCAGLSSLSPSAKSDAGANNWMINSSEYVLKNIGPKVLFGENAPRLASAMGEPVVNRLKEVGSRFGYSFMVYKTKSILHGMSQVRDRTFFFFFKDDKIPLLPYFSRSHEKIEDTIRRAKYDEGDPMSVLTSNRKPSEQPLYRYVLEEIEGGISHVDFQRKITKTTNSFIWIEANGISYDKVSKWMVKNDYERVANTCLRINEKLKAGGNIMRKTTEIPKDYIGAFVGHLPMELTHPDEDRFLTIRECMTIMALPEDFILQGGIRNLNHICQNVPVTTAMDMAQSVKDYIEGKDMDFINSKFTIIDNKAQEVMRNVSVGTLDGFQ